MPQTLIRFFEVAVALCRSGLLVQHFERLCTFRDAAVKQDYGTTISIVFLDLGTRTCALTAWYHNPNEVHEEIISPEVIRFWPTVCQTFDVMIKHARSIVKNISIYLAQRD